MGKYKAGRIENDDELKDALAQALGLHCFYIGGHVIRDERGWRQNEKSVDYAWLAIIDRFGFGVGGVFSMKFENSDFREHKNPEQLVRGVFRLDAENKITDFFCEPYLENFHDPIISEMQWDLFEANRGICIDGVSYRFHLHTVNIVTLIQVSNPGSAPWKKWEKEIYQRGYYLSAMSGNLRLIEYFSFTGAVV